VHFLSRRTVDAFFIEAHGKGRTVDFCTVNSHCRAHSPHTRRKIFVVRHGRHTAKTMTHGAHVANGVGWGLSCVGNKTHGKELAFAVRPRKNARQRIDLCHAPMQKRRAKVLFQLVVLVTLPCASCLTRQSDLCSFFFFHV
jgi:hypothetical protein